MPVGKNINLEDKLIKKTVSKASNKSRTSSTRNTNITHKASIPSLNSKRDTFKTKKMTFYIKEDLLEKLYSYSYWDRHSLTEAFNIVINDGLEGKNIKEKP